MSLFREWDDITKIEMPPQQSKAFWEAYFLKEKSVYEVILENKEFVIDTTIKEFATRFELDPKFAVGFVDGINTSIKDKIELESLELDSQIKLEIDTEKLFYNMHEAGAEWLYNLPQWDEILTIEKRNEIAKEYKSSKTVVVEEKIGRNDPCHCGSGQKYKKCCGK